MLSSRLFCAPRLLHTSAWVGAAAAPVRRTTYVRRTAVPSSSSAAASAPSAAASSAAPASAASAPTPPSLDIDIDDFPLPAAEIDDYAHLRPPAAPAPARRSSPAPAPAPEIAVSPPLAALPDSTYTPLPSAPALAPQAATGITGEAQALPGERRLDDWSTSFRGLSERPFDKDVAESLLRPLDPEDIEIKPDGLLYLPEIKYRRTLNAAFGPGGWGMAPRGETHVGPRIVSREWALVCLGRLIGVARGEQEFFDPSGIPTATEACKSNALMRCCKDLGIASELWDPRFIRQFKEKYCVEAMVEHVTQKKKRKLWRKKDAKFDYPYKEVGR
ncbi:hypothetical protein Q5752_006920 [Cryptotrichosporon argae]